MSTVTADRTGKIVLLTYSLTASHCYWRSFGWWIFYALIWLVPGAEAKLQCVSEKSRVLIWMQKSTPVPHLNKVTAVIINLIKKRQFWAGWPKGWPSIEQWWHCCTDEPSDHNIVIAHLKGCAMKQTNHFNLGIESRWCLNHVRDL